MSPIGQISLRAHLMRFGLPLLRRISHKAETLEQKRRIFHALETFVPHPPASTRTEHVNAGGVKADLVTTPASRQGRYVLYLHGGAYSFGGPSTYRHVTWRIATVAQASVLIIEYRLAPEHPFPAALDDAVASYRWLLSEGKNPREIVIMGDSAGGGLALALLFKLRDEGVPLPATCVALSPWTDLALTGDSFKSNAHKDVMLNAADVPTFANYYLAGHDPRDPYVSPLYGDPSGLPPTLFHVSEDEILRDDSIRMVEKMRRAHCRAELKVWPKMPHVWHLFASVMPEARFAIADIGKFVNGIFEETAG